MKVLLLTPWDNAWIPYLRQVFEEAGHEFEHAKAMRNEQQPDLVLHGWANGMTSPAFYPKAKNIVFMRRFELYEASTWQRLPWERVDTLICVNDWIGKVAGNILKERGFDVPVKVVYNGVDVSRWTFKERTHGNKIGMACHVHPKKNLPLALQVLSLCPGDYELHIAGEIQDPCTAEYLNEMGRKLRRRVYLYGHIPRAQLDLWWEGMNYCLSSSISEGNPNNVLEAMAKGIMPVVHGWPGAEEQFEPWLWLHDHGAVRQMEQPYESAIYRKAVEMRFGMDNYRRIVAIAEGLS